MRGPRLALAGLVATAALLTGASAAVAQTTTVPPIPVTGGGTATTTTSTTVATSTGSESGATGDLADTGIAADMLVPLGFTLIGLGAVMQAASRRPRRAYGLL